MLSIATSGTWVGNSVDSKHNQGSIKQSDNLAESTQASERVLHGLLRSHIERLDPTLLNLQKSQIITRLKGHLASQQDR